MNVTDKIIIHGNEWKQSDVKEEIDFCLTKNWSRKHWVKNIPNKPTAIHPHDHCQICWWELFETGSEEHSIGYTDGYRWVCSECFHKFIEQKLNPES
jgi:hypothetical protein